MQTPIVHAKVTFPMLALQQSEVGGDGQGSLTNIWVVL